MKTIYRRAPDYFRMCPAGGRRLAPEIGHRHFSLAALSAAWSLIMLWHGLRGCAARTAQFMIFNWPLFFCAGAIIFSLIVAWMRP